MNVKKREKEREYVFDEEEIRDNHSGDDSSQYSCWPRKQTPFPVYHLLFSPLSVSRISTTSEAAVHIYWVLQRLRACSNSLGLSGNDNHGPSISALT